MNISSDSNSFYTHRSSSHVLYWGATEFLHVQIVKSTVRLFLQDNFSAELSSLRQLHQLVTVNITRKGHRKVWNVIQLSKYTSEI